MPEKNALAAIDAAGFARELKLLRAEIDANIGEEDFRHLKKIEWWGRICSILGYATAPIFPNPLSAFLISQGNTARWTIMMHHIGHKGYDKVSCPERYKSTGFAVGKRRFIDWFDWMHPEAWKHEHNVLHHYHTGEVSDPDLVERNVELIRTARIPVFMKYFAVLFFMCTWKFTYYAPNTFWIFQKNRDKKARIKNEVKENGNFPGSELLLPFSKQALEFWAQCMLPYILIRFIALPLLFLPFGTTACLYVLFNSLLAELITNIHTFMIIAPNHAGDDVFRYETRTRDLNEFYIRQVAGSVNYPCGNDRVDFMHGWLNYQIEHHLFPDLPLLKYQQYQPRVKQLCEKYEVPYVQQNVFVRMKKLTEIMVGKKSMLSITSISAKESVEAHSNLVATQPL